MHAVLHLVQPMAAPGRLLARHGRPVHGGGQSCTAARCVTHSAWSSRRWSGLQAQHGLQAVHWPAWQPGVVLSQLRLWPSG